MKKILVIVFVVAFACTAFGQQQDNTVRKKSGTRRQLATILFCGLGGAVLGLSTLSFYGRPQDYLGNIGIGFAAGVIGGTIYVTYRSATTHDYSEDNAELENKKLQWAPLIARDKPDSTALGGQFALRF
jgi:hypothetical protein